MESWEQLVAALGTAVPRLRLRAGVSEQRLVEAEAELGFSLPTEYRAWLRIADGQERGGLALFPLCVWFAPLDEVVALWSKQRRTGGLPPCAMGHEWSDSMRCLCAEQRLGMGMADDGEPACAIALEEGGTNEVLAMFDERHWLVLGRDLASYFTRLARLVERGEVVPLAFDHTHAEVLGLPDGATAVNVIRAS